MLEVRRALGYPVDPAGLAAFRIGFGLLACAAAVRFVALGWVEALLVAPSFHFTWAPWVVVPSPGVLYALFGVQAVAGLCIAAGRVVRPALVVWLVAFGYVELLDKALYLNHYVLFTLLGVTLLLTPASRARVAGGAVPAWVLSLLRIEVGLVYLGAGVAKLNADWLLRAEPLRTWLEARVDMPLIGPWLAWDPTAWLMSWSGAAYDLAIPFLLLHARTRSVGLVLVVAFHVAVGVLFPIGVFPWLMVLGVTLFLPPAWPRRWLGGALRDRGEGRPVRASGLAVFGAVVLLQLIVPARHVAWSQDVAWTEQGYRFGWRVLLHEKTGLVDYRVVEPATGRTWRVYPADELTPLQHQHMRTQPDMIRDYALHLAERHAQQGRQVEVYADAWASLNGHPTQRLLRPDVDLTQAPSVLRGQSWIVPRAAGGR